MVDIIPRAEIEAAAAMLRPDLAAAVRELLQGRSVPAAVVVGRRMVAVICCPNPACQSLAVIKTHCLSGRTFWKCTECRKRWKEIRDAGAQRAVVA